MTREHDLGVFTSRSREQSLWLREYARQAHGARSAHVMAVAPEGSSAVVAYYAWAMAGVAVEDLPSRVSKGVGRHPQQFALLARLAADQAHEGRRLGHGLLADVVTRTIAASQAIRCRGLLVHFETDAARNFSMHALPEFAPRPSEPIHLLVLVKDLRRAVG